MTALAPAVFLLSLVCAQASTGQTAATVAEVIAEIRVHGNHVTSDEEVVRLAGVAKGDPFGPTTLADVRGRLRAARLFDTIEVLKRFTSIDDPQQITLVIIVNEGPVRIELPEIPGGPTRVVRRRGFRNLMFMPILDGEDGYGFTYGVRIAYLGVVGKKSRLSTPLTWGGFKRAGVELDRRFERGPISRIEFGGAIQRRKNPAYEEDDDRQRVWARAERVMGPIRGGGTVGWQRVSFGEIDDDLRTVGVDIAFDTRLDPVLPRNAVYAAASWERTSFESGGSVDRTRLDGRAYVAVVGQTVLVFRALREDASEPLPLYLRSLLGGWSSLRGFKAGAFTGDTLVAGSIELRFPISSPLSFGKLGLSVFVDTGTAYDKGAKFRDQTLSTGIGGSVWMTVTGFRMSLGVAHGRGSGTRVNFGGGLTF